MISTENVLFGIGALILGVYILIDTTKVKPSQNDIFIIKTKGYTAGVLFVTFGIYLIVTEIGKMI